MVIPKSKVVTTKKLIFRRFVAFCIDYVIIGAYIILLFSVSQILELDDMISTPINGQLLGFFSLTLPVFLYFFLSENGRSKATYGKRIMNISICSNSEKTNPKIFQRNILKFLPWELAHTGVHWIIFYSIYENYIPLWVWFLLITPQLIVIFYIFTIFISKGERSVYDDLSNSKVRISD